uniref:Uncharacterized protein n=1 Tax=Arundo donax TaxID=35708 RepID=A0A0A9D0B8_ARUDO
MKYLTRSQVMMKRVPKSLRGISSCLSFCAVPSYLSFLQFL